MAQSPEVQVMVALCAALTAGLAAPPPGDWDYVQAPDVRRAPVPPEGQQVKPDECPILYVVPGQGSHFRADAGVPSGYKPGAWAGTYMFHVDLWGFVWRERDDAVLADDERLNLRSHVADIVMAHRHLGGLSRDGITFVGAGPDGRGRPEAMDIGTLAPAAFFVLPITIPIVQGFSTVPA